MKILVSGASGFIGSRLLKALEKDGHDVDNYDLVNGDDIRDKFKLDEKFLKGNYDVVMHLAAIAGTARSDEFPDEYISTNIGGTNNIVKLCKKYNVKHLIHFSSSSVVAGNKNKLSKEIDPYNPVNIYGVTKVAGELIVKKSGVNYTIVRPFTVYGSNGRKDAVLYKWIEQIKHGGKVHIYGIGDSSRGYTHVDDIVNAVLSILKIMSDGHPDLLVNVGGTEEITILGLFEMFKKHCELKNIQFEYEHCLMSDGDVDHSCADTTLANALFEYKPEKKFK